MTTKSQNFWNFSVQLYARERVADACLSLQNSYRIDINLLLFCYWHGLNHGECPDITLQQALTQSLVWKQQVVQPLRNVRQWMKEQGQQQAQTDQVQFETLRERIKFDELAAERLQQEMLEQIALANTTRQNSISGEVACQANIAKFFRAIELEMNDFIAIKLRTIAGAL